MLVGSRPLHAHGFAHSLCEKGGIGRSILVAIPAVAARSFQIDAAHVLGWKPKHFGELFLQIMRRLRSGPRCQFAILEFSNRAGRANRAMRVDGEIVSRTKLPNADFLQCLGSIARTSGHFVLCYLRSPDIVEKLGLIRQPFPL